MNEFQIIEHHFMCHAIGRDDVRLGIGDDAALLRVPGGARVLGALVTLTATGGERGEAFARRLLARVLARLACKSVAPRWATLALTLPRDDTGWLRAFAERLSSELAQRRIALVGGDTTRGPTTATLAMHGHVRDLTAPLAARAGDHLWMADASDPGIASRLQILARQRASVACDGDTVTATGRLLVDSGLRVTFHAASERAAPAGAVLFAVPAANTPPFAGALHVATLAPPPDA